MNVRINVNELRKYCTVKPTHRFFGDKGIRDSAGNIFIDKGSNILAVAHLDSVSRGYNFSTATLRNQRAVFSELLDDRLGAYIIDSLLPTIGIVPDVLFTQDEESLNSSAREFVPDKEYNWMFQFDRSGTDVVMYDYETPIWFDTLKRAGFRVGTGSYSDIVELEHLGIVGFNFGTGYYQNHTMLSYALLPDTEYMVKKFVRFYDDWHNERLTHTLKPYKPLSYSRDYDWSQWKTPSGTKGSNKSGTKHEMEQCAFCGAKDTSVYYDSRIHEHIHPICMTFLSDNSSFTEGKQGYCDGCGDYGLVEDNTKLCIGCTMSDLSFRDSN